MLLAKFNFGMESLDMSLASDGIIRPRPPPTVRLNYSGDLLSSHFSRTRESCCLPNQLQTLKMAVEWGFKDFRESESVAEVCTGIRIASLQSRDFKLPLWREWGKCKMNKLAGIRGYVGALFPK